MGIGEPSKSGRGGSPMRWRKVGERFVCVVTRSVVLFFETPGPRMMRGTFMSSSKAQVLPGERRCWPMWKPLSQGELAGCRVSRVRMTNLRSK
jgi:hypothetical protein